MLSIRDCMDYCDVTEEEVELVAEHEGILKCAAAQIVCGLVQTPAGVVIVTRYMLDLVDRADRSGDYDKAERALAVCARFMADHPLHH
ncbi:MAG: hypothetical protein H2060_08135 [Azoarcus sp.]|nr:hypothetical protein [Azoarcus sp.]